MHTPWLTGNLKLGSCLLHYYFSEHVFLTGDVDIKQYGTPPKETITAGLLLKNEEGETPLHFAVLAKTLHMIPSELLTKDSMLVKDKYGVTPLHHAAEVGILDKLPRELLTEELLSTKDSNGHSPLHCADDWGTLDQLLGIAFSPAIIAQVGQAWYNKNANIVSQKNLPSQDQAHTDLELF